MKNETLNEIQEHLNNLADAFGARAPSAGAMKIWATALSGVDEKFVLQAFALWADHNRKMPTPADVRTEAYKLQSEWIEEEQRLEKLELARSPSAPQSGKASPATIRAFKRHQELIALASKNSPDNQWLWNLLDKHVNNKPNRDGTRLFACQIDVLHKEFGNPIPKEVIDNLPRHKDRYSIPPFSQILAEEMAKENSGKQQTIEDDYPF